ncbi:hypothetical protein Dimus_024087 [Dionaea muscipula]
MAALDKWKQCSNAAIKLSEAEISFLSFLSQKAQIQYIQQWLEYNFWFFYAIDRRNSSRGQISSDAAEFIRFYQQLLGTVLRVDQIDNSITLMGNLISVDDGNSLCKPVISHEIKTALWSIGENKGPVMDSRPPAFTMQHGKLSKCSS